MSDDALINAMARAIDPWLAEIADEKGDPAILEDARKSARAALAVVREREGWRTDMENAPKFPGRRAFLVRAFFADRNYLTDPWAVFRDADGAFARWPHGRPPTMWCPIPPLPFPPEGG